MTSTSGTVWRRFLQQLLNVPFFVKRADNQRTLHELFFVV